MKASVETLEAFFVACILTTLKIKYGSLTSW